VFQGLPNNQQLTKITNAFKKIVCSHNLVENTETVSNCNRAKKSKLIRSLLPESIEKGVKITVPGSTPRSLEVLNELGSGACGSAIEYVFVHPITICTFEVGSSIRGC
jgi:hypothetical protein